MRIEFSNLKLYDGGKIIAGKNDRARVLITELEGDIQFLNQSNDLVFSEVDFNVVLLQKSLVEWLNKNPIVTFVFEGEPIGWLLNLKFDVLADEIVFHVQSAGGDIVRAKFPRKEFLAGVASYCTNLSNAVEKAYGVKI